MNPAAREGDSDLKANTRIVLENIKQIANARGRFKHAINYVIKNMYSWSCILGSPVYAATRILLVYLPFHCNGVIALPHSGPNTDPKPMDTLSNAENVA